LWIYFLVIPEDVLCIHRRHYFPVCRGLRLFLGVAVRSGISFRAQNPFNTVNTQLIIQMATSFDLILSGHHQACLTLRTAGKN
jgi:hypothetical protein